MDQPTPSPPAAASLAARQPPLGLVGGLALGFVVYRIADFHWAGSTWPGFADGGGASTFARWRMVDVGNSFATAALVLVGGLDLARRATGAARRGAHLVVGAAIALLAFALVRQYLSFESSPGSDAGAAQTIWVWLRRGWSTAWLVFTAGLIVAGWRVRLVQLLAAPLVLATLIAKPYHFYAGPLHDLLAGGGPYRWAATNLVIEAVYAALAIAVIWHGAPGLGAAGWDRASRALDRAASALYARLWIAVASGLLVVMLFAGGASPGMAKLFAIGIPTANAIAGIVLVTGVLGAAGLAAPGAPRLRLLVGGAALAWAISIQSIQVFLLLEGLFAERSAFGEVEDFVRALAVTVPFVVAAGLVLFVEGMRGVAAILGSADLRARAGATIVTVVVAQLVVVGGGYWLAAGRVDTREGMITVLLLTIGAAIAMLISIARLARGVAAALRARTDLPTATAMTRA